MQAHDLFIIAIGIVLVIEGAPYALFPRGMKRMMLQVQAIPETALRIIGLAAGAVGFALVFWGKS